MHKFCIDFKEAVVAVGKCCNKIMTIANHFEFFTGLRGFHVYSNNVIGNLSLNLIKLNANTSGNNKSESVNNKLASNLLLMYL